MTQATQNGHHCNTTASARFDANDMLTNVEVCLIRHGETEWSITGQHSGRIDLPLTMHGEDEARAVSGVLDRQSFGLVLCSPLQRARRTCELAGYADVAKIDPELQEWDYGDCTGHTQEQLQEHFPGWTIWDGPVPNGESVEQVGARALRLVERLRILGGRILLFSHGHFLRVLTTQWLGLPPQAGKHFALETSGLSVLGEDAGFPAILAWNLKNTQSLNPSIVSCTSERTSLRHCPPI